MTRENAVSELRSRLTEYVSDITSPSSGQNMYVCPLCGSGTGIHGTGAFSIYANGQKWKCFSCDSSGDIFDLIGQIKHLDNFNDQLSKAAEHFKIHIDESTYSKRSDSMRENENKNTTETTGTDYSDFFKQAQKQLFDENDKRGLEYLSKRGISAETAKKFNLGYVPRWRSPKAPDNVPYSPRIIVPTSKESYLARDIRSDLNDKAAEYTKLKVGNVHIFNEQALCKSDKPIFVVEGEFDALSIIEAGGNAVALGSTSNVKKLFNLIDTDKPKQTLIVALDNDSAGKKAARNLINGLKERDAEYVRYDPANKYKDANDALVADREAFTKAVLLGDDINQIKRERYLRNSAASHLQEFIDGVKESADTPCISTGFQLLDECLGDGLYEGLLTIGAISSLGKTTFMMQMVDHIAASGNDVLIFSLEMARSQLMSKSISRETILDVIANGGDRRSAKTSRGISCGKRYINYNETEKRLIERAITKYGTYADHLYISEGIGDISAEEISETVRQHIKYTGNRPVILVDYLQLLSPCKGYERATDKQIVDKNVLGLKRISRDYKIPVLVVSSFNRDNYDAEVSMAAFKESGAVEYSSDVLIGLQLAGAGRKDFNATVEKKREPRTIELVILKNRDGRVGDKIRYEYYPLFNLFKEVEVVKDES